MLILLLLLLKADEEKENEETQKEDNQDEDGDKSKPVASQLIPGTSWCVVWTGDEKMFFFNPTTRLSIWEKPDELENNDKVDEIVSKGPPKKQPSTELSMCVDNFFTVVTAVFRDVVVQ